MNNLDFSALALIFLVALGTYSLRVSGLLLSSKFSNEGRVKIFLDYLPSTLLLALIFPSIIKEGISGIVATCIIVLCMYKTKNIFLSMSLGVLSVFIFRTYF